LLENPGEVRETLVQLGYLYLNTDAQQVLYLLKRYLTIEGISPLDALNIVLARLIGSFVIFVLNATPDMWLVARKGCPL
jgi:hypothetical protein